MGSSGVALMAGQALDTRMGSQPAGLTSAAGSPGRTAAGDAGAAGGASGGKPGHDEAAADSDGSPGELPAMPSATRLSAAMMTAGSGVSESNAAELIRAPAVAASELPALRAVESGSDGDLVSERQRSSHASGVPPHPLT